MNKNIAMAALISAVSFSALSNAGEFYVGASIGEATFDAEVVDDLEDAGASVDDSDTTIKLFLGNRINENIAIEGFYADLGERSASASGFDDFGDFISADAKADAATFGVAILGIIPVNEKFSIFGKLGMHRWESDSKFSYTDSCCGGINNESYSDDDSGSDIVYGLGLTYDIGRISLRAEYDNYEVDDDDVNTLSIGISTTF